MLGTAPDPVYFEDRVQPILVNSCAITGCHDQPGAGRLILARPDFAGRMATEDTTRNLETALQFVRFGAPMESRLLLKPLVKRDGGLDHSGHHYDFRKDSEKGRTFADWIRGVQLLDVPPVADAGSPRTAKVGQRLVLDGSGSRERRGGPLHHRWSILARPADSLPILKAADTATPEFRGNREGVYTLALVVDNGRLESEPATTTVTLDAEPFVQLEAERPTRVERFHAQDDTAASGGKVLAVDQDVAHERPAAASYELMLPDAGIYRVFARVRAGAGSALSFALDGQASQDLRPEAGTGFHLMAIGTGAAPSRLEGAHASVHAGAAWIENGSLRLAGGDAAGVVLAFDAHAATGGLDALGRIEPAHDGADAMLLAVFQGAQDAGSHGVGAWSGRCAGFDAAGNRYFIGTMEHGVLQVAAERAAVGDPGDERALKLQFGERSAYLVLGPDDVLQTDFKTPPAGDGLALIARGRAVLGALRIEGGGSQQAFGFERDECPPGTLDAGAHVLHVRAELPDAPALDEIHVVRADLEGSLDDLRRKAARSLYLDLLGRPPFPVELLTTAGLDRDALAARLVGTLEFWDNWYEEELFYYLLLDNFRPRTPEMLSIPARLANGQLDVRGATQEIVISQYFNARNPGNDTFVSVVLEQLLGITVQDEPKLLEAGKRMYDGYDAVVFGQTGRSQSDFVNIVLRQDAFDELLIARAYRRLFREEPPRKRLEADAARLRSDPREFAAIVREWIASPAYTAALARARPKTDHMFIRGLFVDLLGRRPSFEEFRNFRSALQALADTRPLRAVLARVILDSGRTALPAKQGLDATAFVREQFLRFLGRAPTAAEARAFAEELKKPEAEPRLVVLALLSCDAYQSY